MNKLQQFIKYNNWEKLQDNLSDINPYYFCRLLSNAVKYHSKECFDVLIGISNIKELINKNSYRLKFIFINYQMAPNLVNEYYINKIIPHMALVDSNVLPDIIKIPNIFVLFFNKLDKNKDTIMTILESCIQMNLIESFQIVFSYLKTTKPDYFTNELIQKNIMYWVLLFDSIDILKYLESEQYDISKTSQFDSLIICIKTKPNTNKCFQYLVSKNYETNQNILWRLFIKEYLNYPLTEWNYYKLNVDWNFVYPENNHLNLFKLEEGNLFTDNEFNQEQINQPKPPINLASLSDFLNQPDEFKYYDDKIVEIIYYLIENSNKPNVKNIIDTINTIPNYDLVEKIIVYLLEYINYVLSRNRYIIYNRYRKSIKAEKIKLIIKIFQIMKYFKTNNLSTYDPFTKIVEIKLIKNKNLVKDIVYSLNKLGYQIVSEQKDQILASIFTKKEIKNMDSLLSKTSFDTFLKQLKKNLKNDNQVPKRRRRILPNPNANLNGGQPQLELVEEVVANPEEVNEIEL